MARRKRMDHEGAWHHVMNRGASHRLIYLDDRDRWDFVDLLSELDERFGVETHAYCLMGNHYHLLLYSREANLSAAMHWLGTCFVGRFNNRHGLDGSPFRGRFHGVPVTEDAHLVAAARYIHRNPIDLGFGRRLHDYRWSSFAAYLDREVRPPWVRTQLVADLSGGHERYRAFVEEDHASDDLFIDEDGSVPLWKPAQVDQLAALFQQLTASPPHTLDLLAATIEAHLGLDSGVVCQRGRGLVGNARHVALVVATDVLGVGLDDLSAYFAFANKNSARAALARSRRTVSTLQASSQPVTETGLTPYGYKRRANV